MWGSFQGCADDGRHQSNESASQMSERAADSSSSIHCMWERRAVKPMKSVIISSSFTCWIQWSSMTRIQTYTSGAHWCPMVSNERIIRKGAEKLDPKDEPNPSRCWDRGWPRLRYVVDGRYFGLITCTDFSGENPRVFLVDNRDKCFMQYAMGLLCIDTI